MSSTSSDNPLGWIFAGAFIVLFGSSIWWFGGMFKEKPRVLSLILIAS